jgi:hypothetical protein
VTSTELKGSRAPSKTAAQFIQVGAIVKHHDLAQVATIPPHRVLAKERHGTPPYASYKITTTEGEWIFSGEEKVTFPRRTDGSKRDWRTTVYDGPPPTPADLAIGDWLDAIDPVQFTNDESAQIVVAITRNPQTAKIVRVTTYSQWDGTHNWDFEWGEPVTFPRPDRPANRDIGYDPNNVKLEGFGPYLYVEPSGDEYLYFLIKHPAGRGRWPSWLTNPIRLSAGVYLIKPPKTPKDWAPFIFVGADKWQRHPKDPAWGHVDAEQEISAERLQLALTIYAKSDLTL